MKTLKFAVIALIVAFTMVSLANADDFKSKPNFKKVVNITLTKALENPGLEAAMYAQIDENDVLNAPNYVLIFEVNYEGSVYRITGTRPQWLRFIRVEGVSPVKLNKGHGIQ